MIQFDVMCPKCHTVSTLLVKDGRRRYTNWECGKCDSWNDTHREKCGVIRTWIIVE